MHEPASHPLTLRRSKPIVSRELPPGTPEVIGQAITIPTDQTPPAIAEVIRSPDAPVVLPTHLGRRKRRSSHARRYRLAQTTVALSMLASAAAIVCLLMGDRRVSWAVGAVAIALALLSILLSWRTRLAGRVLGYAVVAALMAVLTGILSVAAPASWFDDSIHDPSSGRIETVKPRKT